MFHSNIIKKILYYYISWVNYTAKNLFGGFGTNEC